jgi:hypothetical protein
MLLITATTEGMHTTTNTIIHGKHNENGAWIYLRTRACCEGRGDVEARDSLW